MSDNNANYLGFCTILLCWLLAQWVSEKPKLGDYVWQGEL